MITEQERAVLKLISNFEFDEIRLIARNLNLGVTERTVYNLVYRLARRGYIKKAAFVLTDRGHEVLGDIHE